MERSGAELVSDHDSDWIYNHMMEPRPRVGVGACHLDEQCQRMVWSKQGPYCVGHVETDRRWRFVVC